jgi:NAD(P)-dependent dehydrogenase (short-subunit alcohol dehydrogenase family)
MTEKSLSGQVALITGAASGIGRAAARIFAAAGAQIAMVDKNGAGLAEVSKEIHAIGTRGESFTFDLMNWNYIPGLVKTIVAKFGKIDLLLNIAGVSEGKEFLDMDAATWDEVLTVNLRSPFVLMQEVGRHMIERGGGGKMVNVSSQAAYRGSFSNTAYGASKAALNHLTRVAAATFGKYDVNVNAVVPGFTDTPMTAPLPREWIKDSPLANPFHRISTPEDVANVMLFLCQPMSRQIHSQMIHTSAGAVEYD